jgi:uncharacterized damage-inducible protein DinB
MSMADAFVMEMDQEVAATRRLLERVPEDRLDWKPHEKSFSLGQLALHVARIPGDVAALVQQDEVPAPDFKAAAPADKSEILDALNQAMATTKDLLGKMDDAALGTMFRVVADGKEVFAAPKGGVLRAIGLNHWYHHRGELVVYLRLLDVPVPSTYGPSADENPFAM